MYQIDWTLCEAVVLMNAFAERSREGRVSRAAR
ncbi:hypothetical protein BURCENBC7_AP0551 [Burkholderia cenocepacia BC7]|nr:hypothetical protein BURCENK562V_C2544 [Burkholderia cenocepacia K56-2Valvano]ERI31168.1 hypothetical protein BURCENBC7_AP0551 [Burkholderia cenocepacia BC7]